MFWFKNVMIYRLTKTLDWSTDKLQEVLQGHKYIPCDKSEMSRFGWTSPIINSELLYHAAENKILLVAMKEEKILPAQPILGHKSGKAANTHWLLFMKGI
ncbi:recombination-associated protein RdgC [Pasteurella multocida]|uniref:recombination-associated protein RdgC n=1 Tax=Pasteurella multocida TaxID=747 RepID=UPI00397884AF